MRPHSRFLMLLVLLSGLLAMPGRAQDGHAIVLSEDPRLLLKLLPEAPPHWELAVSVGISTPTETPSLLSRARRDYKYVPPPPAPGTKPAPSAPKTVRLQLIDTGFDISQMGIFKGFKVTGGTPDGGKDANFIKDGFPVVQSVAGGMTKFYIKISNRFWVEMALQNPDKGDEDQWLAIANLPALAAATKDAPAAPLPPHTFPLVVADELDPSNNSEVQQGYETPAEHENAVKHRFDMPVTPNRPSTQ